jgi:hypothetical protein
VRLASAGLIDDVEGGVGMGSNKGNRRIQFA